MHLSFVLNNPSKLNHICVERLPDYDIDCRKKVPDTCLTACRDSEIKQLDVEALDELRLQSNVGSQICESILYKSNIYLFRAGKSLKERDAFTDCDSRF